VLLRSDCIRHQVLNTIPCVIVGAVPSATRVLQKHTLPIVHCCAFQFRCPVCSRLFLISPSQAKIDAHLRNKAAAMKRCKTKRLKLQRKLSEVSQRPYTLLRVHDTAVLFFL